MTKIASMLARATEHTAPVLPAAGAASGRFARQPAEFATSRSTPANERTTPAANEGTTWATDGASRLTLIHGGADAPPPPVKEPSP